MYIFGNTSASTERITCNDTFAENIVTLITIGQIKVTFQMCLDFHWKDPLNNSNHLFLNRRYKKSAVE